MTSNGVQNHYNINIEYLKKKSRIITIISTSANNNTMINYRRLNSKK